MSRIGPRGIPEVPMLSSSDPELRRFLVDLRQSVLNLRPTQTPLSSPTNLQVTPQDRANLIQFTRSANADFFELLWSLSNDISKAQIVNILTSNSHLDWIGQAGVTRFYWVRAGYFTSSIRSNPVGPISGTSLGVGTAVNFPTPPPPGPLSFNQRLGYPSLREKL